MLIPISRERSGRRRGKLTRTNKRKLRKDSCSESKNVVLTKAKFTSNDDDDSGDDGDDDGDSSSDSSGNEQAGQ